MVVDAQQKEADSPVSDRDERHDQKARDRNDPAQRWVDIIWTGRVQQDPPSRPCGGERIDILFVCPGSSLKRTTIIMVSGRQATTARLHFLAAPTATAIATPRSAMTCSRSGGVRMSEPAAGATGTVALLVVPADLESRSSRRGRLPALLSLILFRLLSTSHLTMRELAIRIVAVRPLPAREVALLRIR